MFYLYIQNNLLQILNTTFTIFFYFSFQCFYIPKCRKDYAATHAIVQNISERLKSQHTVQCFVDPADRVDSAILTQIYGRVAVFHSLFWPTCTLIGGTIIIAMVKLTQYLSIMCERLSRIKRWSVRNPKGCSHHMDKGATDAVLWGQDWKTKWMEGWAVAGLKATSQWQSESSYCRERNFHVTLKRHSGNPDVKINWCRFASWSQWGPLVAEAQ